ncbi:T9SS type A sorting domain-containing protein [Bacteroidota bacterium]
MKKFALLFIITLSIIILGLISEVFGQPNNSPKLSALSVKAEVTQDPSPQIKISWEKHPYAKSYEIRRKNFGDAFFSNNALAQLDTGTTFFVDDNVMTGHEYEYEVRAIYLAKQDPIFVGDTIGIYDFAATGYIYSGIDVDVKSNFDKCLLLIDENIADALPGEISRLEMDLVQEGWHLVKRYVPRTEEFDGDAVKNVKNIIMEEAEKEPEKEMYIFLLGRVAVPYSGNIVPDGHSNNHWGAWPCDGYYGSLNENAWTDNYANSTATSREENKNAPGDGKFDQSKFEFNPVNCPVGRVDFYNMPTFEESETELIKQYLDKDHEYRTGNMPYISRGLIDDNFGMYGLNGFSSTAWRVFPLFFGADSIHEKSQGYDWFTNLSTENYLWAYGCGGGSYTSCGGIGVSEQFDTTEVNSIFTMLFGSYFGDWDSQNNILRASLCSSPSVLTCCWAGRPHWFLQHMDLGMPIGFGTKLSQNNKNQYLGLSVSYMNNWYYINQSAQEIHIALMGDPTLRMYMGTVPEPANLSVVQLVGRKVELTWNEPEISGDYSFNVYRSDEPYGPFEKINTEPVEYPDFMDEDIAYGSVYYMVRTVKIETTNSGSFKNLSRGIIQSIVVSDVEDIADVNCSVSCYPNPATKEVNLSISIDNNSDTEIEIYDSRGNKVKGFNFNTFARGEHIVSWNLIDDNGMNIPSGIYYVRVRTNDKVKAEKFSVIR